MHIQAMAEAFDFDRGLLLAVQGVQVKNLYDHSVYFTLSGTFDSSKSHPIFCVRHC
jgi:hypothetical protein